ncbi:MAG: exo-beta-N-acetylmuramidase NamZ family protein [Bacteroidia bacterium]
MQIQVRLFSFFLLLFAAAHLPAQIIIRPKQNVEKTDAEIRTGAERTDVWIPMLQGKSVAVVANHTSLIGKTHLLDTMLRSGIRVKKVLAPEHGFRGMAANGQQVASTKDAKTGLPIISLYGDHKKPTTKDLKGIDVVVFDIQDVGVRFYTYISTLTYVMEACAEQKKKLIVLDRPNPNGYYVDGPILQPEFKSFVGLHPVPVVHGMTVAEYARMVNEEGWLTGGIKCDLSWVSCEGYTHSDWYQLPVAPSPNLPNMTAVYLYPSLCFFEGTVISVGRGTDFPFQVIGHPDLIQAPFKFTPTPRTGAPDPPYNGTLCYGHDFRDFALMYVRDYRKLYLFWMMGAYKDMPDKANFFNPFFEKLAGTAEFRKQIIAGTSEDDIRKIWEPNLIKYKLIRKKYLIYSDFE